MSKMNNLININEVSEIMGIKKSTIYKKIKAGNFPPGRTDGRLRRWDRAEVEAFSRLYWRCAQNDTVDPVEGIDIANLIKYIH